jgi:hypothetical protein
VLGRDALMVSLNSLLLTRRSQPQSLCAVLIGMLTTNPLQHDVNNLPSCHTVPLDSAPVIPS